MNTNNIYTHFTSVKFPSNPRAYFFGTNNPNLKVGDYVIVSTVRGNELGTVVTPLEDISKCSTTTELKPIIGLATREELTRYEENKAKSLDARIYVEETIEQLKLDMRVLSCDFFIDGSKLMITYVSDNRVDFRELLQILATKFRTRIDLRQIGSRDKAKVVGGIGICGLPICCSYFLSNFEGTSINMAKNQMLVLNIPKLSGHCGKLVCCLAYEDDMYTELKQKLPRIGTTFEMDGLVYRIGAMNVLSRVFKVESNENIKFLHLNEFKKYLKFHHKNDSHNKPNHNNNHSNNHNNNHSSKHNNNHNKKHEK